MDVEEALKTMIENLYKNTGKTLEEWIAVVKTTELVKHGEIIKYLKTEHGFTHGFANLVAHKANSSDAGSVEKTEDLVEEQYKGKEELKEIYYALIAAIEEFGDDVELSPKKAYVSLRRKKQFGLIQPSTKSRLDLGLNFKGVEATSRLEVSGSFNAMCSHRVRLSNKSEVNAELIAWLKAAYEQAG